MLTVIYDDHCPLCRGIRDIVRRLDWLGQVSFADLSDWSTIAARFPALDREECLRAMHGVDERGRIHTGFQAFRKMISRIPAGWILLPFLYIPGASILGGWIYRRLTISRKRDAECCQWHG